MPFGFVQAGIHEGHIPQNCGKQNTRKNRIILYFCKFLRSTHKIRQMLSTWTSGNGVNLFHILSWHLLRCDVIAGQFRTHDLAALFNELATVSDARIL